MKLTWGKIFAIELLQDQFHRGNVDHQRELNVKVIERVEEFVYLLDETLRVNPTEKKHHRVFGTNVCTSTTVLPCCEAWKVKKSVSAKRKVFIKWC